MFRRLTKSPAETTDGEGTYTSAAFTNNAFSVQTTTKSVVPSLNKLMGLKLPTNTKTVAEEAFADGAFEYVIIPESCTSIGSRAFAENDHLIYVKMPAGITIAADAFENCREDLIIDQLP